MTLAELAQLNPNNIDAETRKALNRLDGLPESHLNISLFAAPNDDEDNDLDGEFEEELPAGVPTPNPSCSAM